MKREEKHWADKEEVIKSNKPLKILLTLLKILPGWIVRSLAYPISLFYFLFSKDVRLVTKEYQNQLRTFSNGDVPKKISCYKQVVSFALCLFEKVEGWLGKIPFDRIEYQDDDIKELLNNLKEGKGAFIISSHLGNMELLRSLSDYNTELVNREVPIYIVMDVGIGQQFNKTLQEINPNFSLNIIDSENIGPDAICTMIDAVESGSLVFIAGDRTSAQVRNRCIKQSFLGKEALFPYGTFLIPALMKTSVYYMFGLREKISIFNPKYEAYIEKSKVDFINYKRNEREDKIKECCAEFAGKLEKFCKLYPYQWYNFFNFWDLSTGESK